MVSLVFILFFRFFCLFTHISCRFLMFSVVSNNGSLVIKANPNCHSHFYTRQSHPVHFYIPLSFQPLLVNPLLSISPFFNLKSQTNSLLYITFQKNHPFPPCPVPDTQDQIFRW